MKRSERVSAIVKILSDSPNQSYSLGTFCQMFGAAKSSISEDLQAARNLLEKMELGYIETTSGAGGGVRFIPSISDQAFLALQMDLCEKLKEPARQLAGGFLYTSDIMFNARLMKKVAHAFARKFQDSGADYVVTIETKGIAVATMVSDLLNIPLVVIRRESKISEGSTVSINYFSGSSDRVQKMSIAKRAVEPGSRALIIDDFMRAGGSVKGIADILTEFEVEIVGTGLVIVTTEPERKTIPEYSALLYLAGIDPEKKELKVFPNIQFF